MRQYLLSLSLCVCISVCAVVAKAAESTDDGGPQLEYSDSPDKHGPGFAPAVLDKKVPRPPYPMDAIVNFAEGWVVIGFTITPEGGVQNATIVDEVGPKSFQKAVLLNVNNRHYMPATQDGVPVAQNVRQRFVFRTCSPGNCDDKGPREKGARTEIVSAYRKARRLIEGGQTQQAIDLIEPMQNREMLNFYERSMMSALLGFAYAEAGEYQTAQQQFKRAVWSDAKYLETRSVAAVYHLLIVSEYSNGHYAEAREDYEAMSKTVPADNEVLVKAKEIITSIDASLANPAGIAVSARLSAPDDPGGDVAWRHKPSRKTIAFEKLQGKLDRFEFRCDTKTVTGQINSEYEYTLPASWNKCWLSVFGAPGATFTLVELP